MDVVVIDRSKWVRRADTEQYGDTALLNERGRLCCLGFLALSCGLTRDDISGRGLPSAFESRFPFPNALFRTTDLEANQDVEGFLIGANDRSDTDAEAEEKIVMGFAAMGIKAVFVDRYVSPGPCWQWEMG